MDLNTVHANDLVLVISVVLLAAGVLSAERYVVVAALVAAVVSLFV